MITELCRHLPPRGIVQVIGDPEDSALQKWLSNSGLGNKVKVVVSAPRCPANLTGVAFILNSAYLHRQSVSEMLSAGYNVVCEKPMSFSKLETQRLVNMAARFGLQLFSTNTYLFASYLDVFKQNWLEAHSHNLIRISWADPINEFRHGGIKHYDSSLPLIYDILPHIANILLATIGPFNFESNRIEVRRGGSEVFLHYQQEGMNIYLTLERNSSQRKRTLFFSNAENEVKLNFDSEPGLVSLNKTAPISVDPSWKYKSKPIAAMIQSLVAFFETGKEDLRLSFASSLLANSLIDSVVSSYVNQQVALMTTRHDISDPKINRACLEYAEKEAQAIAKRAMPYINEGSPLHTLALLGSRIKRET